MQTLSGAGIIHAWADVDVFRLVSGYSDYASQSRFTIAGSIKFTSPSTSLRGTFTFTVKGIGRTGYSYDSTANKETSDFIVR